MGNGVFRHAAWVAATVVAVSTAAGVATALTTGGTAAMRAAAAETMAAGAVTGTALTLLLIAAAVTTPTRRVVYYTALLALMALAILVNPWTVFAVWILSVHAFALFSATAGFAWSVVGAVLVTGVQTRDAAELVPVAISLLTPLIVGGIRLARESEARRRAIEEVDRLRQELLRHAEAAGREDERRRVARDIHDTLAQDLSAAAVLLGPAADGDDSVAKARDLVRNGLAEARRSVQALTPAPLADRSLPEALRELVEDWADRTGNRADLDADDIAPGPEVAAAVYRVGQSALANVAEHAGAKRVRLTLTAGPGAVVLDVRDDGTGITTPKTSTPTRGYGLAGMRQRVAELGGTLEVETAPGEGTAVRATIPAGAA